MRELPFPYELYHDQYSQNYFMIDKNKISIQETLNLIDNVLISIALNESKIFVNMTFYRGSEELETFFCLN